MYTRAAIMHRQSQVFIASFVLLLVLVLSACGTNGTTSGSASGTTTSTPGATATATQAQGTKDGCPNTTVVTTAPPAATIVLTSSQSGATINAKQGDTIEINLPFGHLWQGPTNASLSPLAVQGPAGYAYSSARSCVWRYVAASTGTVHLNFVGRPICQKNQACPMYLMDVPFTIDVK